MGQVCRTGAWGRGVARGFLHRDGVGAMERTAWDVGRRPERGRETFRDMSHHEPRPHARARRTYGPGRRIHGPARRTHSPGRRTCGPARRTHSPARRTYGPAAPIRGAALHHELYVSARRFASARARRAGRHARLYSTCHYRRVLRCRGRACPYDGEGQAAEAHHRLGVPSRVRSAVCRTGHRSARLWTVVPAHYARTPLGKQRRVFTHTRRRRRARSGAVFYSVAALGNA